MTLVSLHEGLAAHARKGVRGITEAASRRTVSSAYYALFHLIIDHVVGFEYPTGHTSTDAELNDFGRKIDHKVAVHVFRCMLPTSPITPKQPIRHITNRVGRTPSAEVVSVSDAFLHLYDLRIFADYDKIVPFPKSYVVLAVAEAEDAMSVWKKAKQDGDPGVNDVLDCIAILTRPMGPRPAAPANLWR